MKIKIALFCLTMLGLSTTLPIAAQTTAPVHTNTMVSTFTNLTRPGAPAAQTLETDEVELVWNLNPTAAENAFPGTPLKMECHDIQLYAQLQLGAPTPIATLSTTNEAQTVRVRFRPGDYAYLLTYYKTDPEVLKNEVIMYVKFGDIMLYSDAKQATKATIADRQRWIRIVLT